MKRYLAIVLPILALGALIFWRVSEKRAAAEEMTKQREARAGAAPQVLYA